MLSAIKKVFGSPSFLTSAAFGVFATIVASVLTYMSAKNTLDIEYTKQISTILPNIYSADDAIRKPAIIALGSYGDKSQAVLLNLLSDSNDVIKNNAVDALFANKNISAELIENIALNKKLFDANRAGALYAIGYKQTDNAQKTAEKIWSDKSESSMMKRHALVALAYLRDKNNSTLFLSIINDPYYKDSQILSDAIFGYGEVSTSNEFMNAVAPHLLSKEPHVTTNIWNKLAVIPGSKAGEMMQKNINCSTQNPALKHFEN